MPVSAHWDLTHPLLSALAFPSRSAPVARADRGLDLLITYRVYDPEGDHKEEWPDDDEPGSVELMGASRVSPEFQEEEIKVMLAAALPGGLSGRVAQSSHAVAPQGKGGGNVDEFSQQVDGGSDGGGGAVKAGDVGERGEIAEGDVYATAVGEGSGSRSRVEAAPSGEEAIDEGGGGGGGDGVRPARYTRFFGLPFEDEWISATSNRIEKLNSRASWRNSWTEEVRRLGPYDRFSVGVSREVEAGRPWVDRRRL